MAAEKLAMTRDQLDAIRAWLKADIGVTHNKRDEYYDALICAAVKYIQRRGITLNLRSEDDIALVEMYAAHMHERRRTPTAAMPEFLRMELHNRLLAEKMRPST